MPKLSPFLWFDTQAEDAAKLYCSLFPNSRIKTVTRYGAAGPGPAGSVMTVVFELDGLEVIALNGGPHFKHTEAFSFSVDTKDQKETDHYWYGLIEGGGKEGQCGWLTDRFGLSWQVNPGRLGQLLGDPDPGRSQRAMQAMLKMTKIDIAALEKAANGG